MKTDQSLEKLPPHTEDRFSVYKIQGLGHRVDLFYTHDNVLLLGCVIGATLCDHHGSVAIKNHKNDNNTRHWCSFQSVIKCVGPYLVLLPSRKSELNLCTWNCHPDFEASNMDQSVVKHQNM